MVTPSSTLRNTPGGLGEAYEKPGIKLELAACKAVAVFSTISLAPTLFLFIAFLLYRLYEYGY